MSASVGKVFLVGAGPGDPELVTLRAQRLLLACDTVIHDYLVNPVLLEWPRQDARRICVGKRAGFHNLPQEEIQALLIAEARAGRHVVRLKGGDPFIFGRGGEEAQALREAGVPFEVVPGVTAGLGCAAYAGVPLTHRHHAAAVTFLSGHQAPDKDAENLVDWAAYARTDATLVLYMAVHNLGDVCRALIAGGRPASQPVVAVERGTEASQRVLRSTLGEIEGRAKEDGLAAPATIIVGEVAALHDVLAWWPSRRDREPGDRSDDG